MSSLKVYHQDKAKRKTALGLILMALGFFCFSIADLLSKLLSDVFHPTQVAWFRQLGLFAGVIYLLAFKGSAVFVTQHPGKQIFRGLMSAATPALFILAIAHMPLADAVAVTFVAPFFVVILGALILQEKISTKQLYGIVGAFIGTLIIIRPGEGLFQPAVGFILLAALGFALRQVLSRMITGSDSSSTTIAYGGTVSIIALGVLVPFYWRTPETGEEIILLTLLAVTAGLAELLLIRALDIALAVLLAPVQYTLIFWSTAWGWIFFSDLPDTWTLIGSALIVISGVLSSGAMRYPRRT